jgi:hypothetical protein
VSNGVSDGDIVERIGRLGRCLKDGAARRGTNAWEIEMVQVGN